MVCDAIALMVIWYGGMEWMTPSWMGPAAIDGLSSSAGPLSRCSSPCVSGTNRSPIPTSTAFYGITEIALPYSVTRKISSRDSTPLRQNFQIDLKIAHTPGRMNVQGDVVDDGEGANAERCVVWKYLCEICRWDICEISRWDTFSMRYDIIFPLMRYFPSHYFPWDISMRYRWDIDIEMIYRDISWWDIEMIYFLHEVYFLDEMYSQATICVVCAPPGFRRKTSRNFLCVLLLYHTVLGWNRTPPGLWSTFYNTHFCCIVSLR